MAKLIILLLALAFTAHVSAHCPTLSEEGGSVHSKQQCSQQLQGQRFNKCQSYIQNKWCCIGDDPGCFKCGKGEEGLGLGLEGCCNELKKVEEECQCEAMQEVYKAMQEVYRQPQEQQRSQQSSRQPQTQHLKQIVQNLRNQCNLQV